MTVKTSSNPLSEQMGEGALPRENVQFSIIKGTAIMHGTVDPKEFLIGATPQLDKAALSRYEDDALESKILRASLTACIGLGEQIRRVENLRLQKVQSDETLKKLVMENAAVVRQMARLEETLRQTTEGWSRSWRLPGKRPGPRARPKLRRPLSKMPRLLQRKSRQSRKRSSPRLGGMSLPPSSLMVGKPRSKSNGWPR
ncbi:unnamed protein product [Cuscuta europaea]|uniref:Uncharacterized protein n=1 Tax=Cuscuta europaea TaxID=41803 RepID=A0A9P0ZXK4_CUSEU|nr:unnamed protein product [Cuscuta europaea]